MLQDLITVRDAAQLVGYHPEHVRELLRAGIVKGQKFGETWQVDRVDLLLYVKRQAHSGNKRGPKTGGLTSVV
jgi:excisionase family DNA binding protein